MKSPARGRAIGVVGLGYVGIATAVSFAHAGKKVVGYDVDDDRVMMLRKGKAPIFEPGLAELVSRHVKNGRLSFADSMDDLLDACNVIFIAVPTPSANDGKIDLSFMRQAAQDLGFAQCRKQGWRLYVVKSTVVPGTTMSDFIPIMARCTGSNPGEGFSVAANPEFLAEGTMVEDALHPSRIVIGVTDDKSERLLKNIYSGFHSKIVVLSPTGAELVKYASNAMLATRVSFANEISRMAELAGVDVYPVLDAVGMDPRIGGKFMRAGPGFGGSCFTKDIKALIAWAKGGGLETSILSATLEVNDRQARHVVDLAREWTGGLKGKKVALLGLSFKADTSDTRDSRAYPILEELLWQEATVSLYDPVAVENFRRGLPHGAADEIGSRILFADSLKEALRNSDIAIIQCDWGEFRKTPAANWKLLKDKVVVDARRTLDRKALAKQGVKYISVGLGSEQ
jgi:UDPglucose 6-dehydrogenase